MAQGEDLKRRLEELAEAGATGREAALAIFTEDYNSPVGELQELLELEPLAIGRIKAIARQRIHRAEREARGGAERALGKPPPSHSHLKPN